MSTLIETGAHLLASETEQILFDERETERYHAPYRMEQALISCIQEGNLAMVEHILERYKATEFKTAQLSDSELRQMQYHAVLLTYMASRAAIDAGMFEADAMNLSDVYIYKFDRLTTPDQVRRLLSEAILDWTRTIHSLRSLKNVSPPVRACLEYMYKHLHSRITLKDLAQVSGISVPYLSVLFKKEVGENFSDYLLRLRIKAAEDMLLNSSRAPKEIGFTLNFSSQSYFIRCFKQITGLTPAQYRKKKVVPRSELAV